MKKDSTLESIHNRTMVSLRMDFFVITPHLR
jgi:hypothetical protein